MDSIFGSLDGSSVLMIYYLTSDWTLTFPICFYLLLLQLLLSANIFLDYLSVCLSLCMCVYVCLFVCLCVCLTVCMHAYLFILLPSQLLWGWHLLHPPLHILLFTLSFIALESILFRLALFFFISFYISICLPIFLITLCLLVFFTSPTTSSFFFPPFSL